MLCVVFSTGWTLDEGEQNVFYVVNSSFTHMLESPEDQFDLIDQKAVFETQAEIFFLKRM